MIPFWLLVAQVGWRPMLGVWPACLVTGMSFGVTQFLISNYHGPWLASIRSSSMDCFLLVLGKPRLIVPEEVDLAALTRTGAEP